MSPVDSARHSTGNYPVFAYGTRSLFYALDVLKLGEVTGLIEDCELLWGSEVFVAILLFNSKFSGVVVIFFFWRWWGL